jgi:hypothetical protein
MARNTRKVLQEGYSRLKKLLEKTMNPKKEQAMPQLALQPIKNKKYLRGTRFL